MKKGLMFITAFLILSVLTSAAYCAEAQKKWTIMVFINADNNLDRYGPLDIQEMERAGLSPDVNIVVQIDRERKPARRYLVSDRTEESTPDDWGIKGRKLEELGEVDMGDYRELVNFVKFAKENYPAEHYLLDIWNHGMGWKNKPLENTIFRGVSYDDQSKNHISTKDLGIATREIAGILGKKLDIIAFDACLMAMMEVAFEVSQNCCYMVGSEETEPGDGWNYELAFGPLMKKPSMSPLSFAKVIVGAYGQNYANQNATQSAIKLSVIKNLAEAVNELAVAILEIEGTDGNTIKGIVRNTQKFRITDNIDLGHFTKQVLDTVTNEKVKAAAEKVLMYYQKAVVASIANGYGMKNATGLAIYFPLYYFESKYSTIKFSEYRWDEMVNAIMKVAPPASSSSQSQPVTGQPSVVSQPSSSTPTVGSGYHHDAYPDVIVPGMPGFPHGWGPHLPPLY